MGGGDSERENTLISLLNEMDGFVGSGVVVLAATNRADLLDAALDPARPARPAGPGADARPARPRADPARARARASRWRPTSTSSSIARQTPGMSGADLARVVNEACIAAARHGLAEVTTACFQEAVAVVAMGRARTSALITEHDRLITAWHEAGHTVAALVQPDADDPVSVTIIPRGAERRRDLDGRQRQQLPHPRTRPAPGSRRRWRAAPRRRSCSTASTPRAPPATCRPRRSSRRPWSRSTA